MPVPRFLAGNKIGSCKVCAVKPSATAAMTVQATSTATTDIPGEHFLQVPSTRWAPPRHSMHATRDASCNAAQLPGGPPGQGFEPEHL